MRKSIAVDMDGVIADEVTQLVSLYETHYGIKVHASEIIGRHEDDVVPHKDAYNTLSKMPGFFRTMPVMPGAVEAVKQLQERYEIYIVSAAMQYPYCLSEKREWLNEHFPSIDWRHIVFC